jgi:O-antigen ligase
VAAVTSSRRLKTGLPRAAATAAKSTESWLSGLPRWLTVPIWVIASALGIAQLMLMLPPEGHIVLIIIGAGVTVWVLFPMASIYAVVILSPFEMTYQMGGLNGVRALDAVIFTLVVVTSGSIIARSRRISRFDSPLMKLFMGIWFFLAIWNGITFVMGEANQYILGGVAKNIWYIYRESFRVLLPFPLLVYCLPDRRAALRIVDLLLAVTTGIAVNAWFISQLTHQPAMAPFNTKNALAGFMILVVPFCITRLLFETDMRWRIFYAVLLALLVRVLWLTGSRGGMVAFLASTLPLVLRVPWKRLAVVGGIGVLAVGLFALTRGNILDKPMVQRFLTIADPGEERNFQWRLEQWQLIGERVKQNPWMGTGSDTDPELAKLGRLQTAHNGYLGLVLRAGIPASATWIVLLGLVGMLCVRFVRKSRKPEDLAFWLGMSGCLIALAVHNMNETTIFMPQVQLVFWTLLAVSMVLAIDPTRRNPAAPAGAGRK